MNRESFLHTVKQQYTDEINEAYLECEHEGTVDFRKLGLILQKLMKSAKVEGLPTRDFEELVRSLLPDVIAQLDFRFTNTKAA